MTDAGAGGRDPLTALLAVQDLDMAIAQHEHRKAALPERRELDEVQATVAARRRSQAELDGQHQELATRLNHLEEQSASVVARRKTLEDRMYGARGAAGRDLAAIESEVTQLAGRLGQLEDDELVLLEEQEPLDAELGRLQADLAGLATRVAELSGRWPRPPRDRRGTGRAARTQGRRGRAPSRAAGHPLRGPAGPPGRDRRGAA